MTSRNQRHKECISVRVHKRFYVGLHIVVFKVRFLIIENATFTALSKASFNWGIVRSITCSLHVGTHVENGDAIL